VQRRKVTEVQRLAVGMAHQIEPGPVVEARGLHHQRVAVPLANRAAQPCRLLELLCVLSDSYMITMVRGDCTTLVNSDTSPAAGSPMGRQRSAGLVPAGVHGEALRLPDASAIPLA
jgi:hypothetical protein